MVAASKLRRAQEAIVSARPYAGRCSACSAAWPRASTRRRTRSSTCAAAGPTADAADRHHRRQGPVRQLQHQHHQGGRRVHRWRARSTCALGLVGRKGRDFFAPPRLRRAVEQVGIFQKLRYEDAQAIAQRGDRGVHEGQVDRVYARLQRVQVGHAAAHRRRPAAADRARRRRRPAGARRRRRRRPRAQVDYLYEPTPQEIFNQLLPRYVEVQVYRALLESNAAFTPRR